MAIGQMLSFDHNGGINTCWRLMSQVSIRGCAMWQLKPRISLIPKPPHELLSIHVSYPFNAETSRQH
jgi:hypothetical protein